MNFFQLYEAIGREAYTKEYINDMFAIGQAEKLRNGCQAMGDIISKLDESIKQSKQFKQIISIWKPIPELIINLCRKLSPLIKQVNDIMKEKVIGKIGEAGYQRAYKRYVHNQSYVSKFGNYNNGDEKVLFHRVKNLVAELENYYNKDQTSIAGTPAYMSPEAYGGESSGIEFNFTSDINLLRKLYVKDIGDDSLTARMDDLFELANRVETNVYAFTKKFDVLKDAISWQQPTIGQKLPGDSTRVSNNIPAYDIAQDTPTQLTRRPGKIV